MFLKRYTAHVGASIRVSHSVERYLSYHNTTLVSIDVQNTPLVFADVVLDSSLWSALISCECEGAFSYELKITFGNGEVQVLEFAVDVENPANQGVVGGRFGRG